MNAALVLLLSAVMTITAAHKPKTAWDTVQSLAKQSGHRLTITHRNDYYWIEMDHSDLAGAGKTLEDAAEDLLGAMNMNTEDHDTDTKQPNGWKPPVAPPLITPESRHSI